MYLCDLITGARTPVRGKTGGVLIVIPHVRDASLLGKRRPVYLANVMMPHARAKQDIPTSVRAQEFLPGIVRTPVNRAPNSKFHSREEKKKRRRGERSATGVTRPLAE